VAKVVGFLSGKVWSAPADQVSPDKREQAVMNHRVGHWARQLDDCAVMKHGAFNSRHREDRSFAFWEAIEAST
jgi:hypothetical protein